MESTCISIVLQSAADVINAKKPIACMGDIPPNNMPHSRDGMNTMPTSNNCCRTGLKARVMDFVM